MSDVPVGLKMNRDAWATLTSFEPLSHRILTLSNAVLTSQRETTSYGPKGLERPHGKNDYSDSATKLLFSSNPYMMEPYERLLQSVKGFDETLALLEDIRVDHRSFSMASSLAIASGIIELSAIHEQLTPSSFVLQQHFCQLLVTPFREPDELYPLADVPALYGLRDQYFYAPSSECLSAYLELANALQNDITYRTMVEFSKPMPGVYEARAELKRLNVELEVASLLVATETERL